MSNLWFMKKWYCFYTQKEAVQKLQRPVAELESEKLQQPVRELDEAKSSRFDREKLQQPVAELAMGKFMRFESVLPTIFTKPHPSPNPSRILYSNLYRVLASVSERLTQLAMDLGTLAALRLSDSPSSVRLTERQRSSVCSRER